MDLKVPDIDPRMLETSNRIAKVRKKAQAKRELREHHFDIAALAISFVSFAVAVASLVFAILAYLK